MNKIAVVLLCLFSTSTVWAFTDIQWLPGDQQALVKMHNAGDDDCARIYKLMRVSPEPSDPSRTKTLSLLDDNFTLVCDAQGHSCNLVFIVSPGIEVSHAKLKIELNLDGEAAENARQLFNLDSSGAVDFESIDSRLYIRSQPGHLQILVQDR